MDNTKEFLVSVGDVMGFDIDTGALLFDAQTLIKSDIKISSSNKEIKGGKGSLTQYQFDYDKKCDVELEESQVKEAFMALCNGTEIIRELDTFYNRDEEHEIEKGKITLDSAPINGEVFIKSEDGETILTKTAIGKNVNIPDFKDGETVFCTYQVKESVDTITIDGKKFGKTIKLVMSFTMSRQGHDGYKEVEIVIPRYKITSNMELNLQHDGVSTSKLSGKALAFGKGKYAKIKIRRVDSQDDPIQSLFTEAEIILNSGEKIAPKIFAERGGVYKFMPLDISEFNITSDKPTVAKVNLTGEVEYVAEGEAMLSIKLKNNEHVKTFAQVICNPK
ncbi:phage protein [Clostridium botulinum B str. Osaka05]|uniref:Phage protein n=1 Tax=Clostridium botulinum B str. Osaka05 TaxID=1407017 RepID=A0A060N4X9_CLOBO|nr:hypothetical protein [Clostridium botulinum]BAO04892.1 phage protein [Clostridium botulinum B str. Osaka05]